MFFLVAAFAAKPDRTTNAVKTSSHGTRISITFSLGLSMLVDLNFARFRPKLSDRSRELPVNMSGFHFRVPAVGHSRLRLPDI